MVGRGKGQELQKWISRFVVSNRAEDFTLGRYSSEENWIWSWNAETASPSENVCVGTDSWKCSKTRPGHFRGRFLTFIKTTMVGGGGDRWGPMGVVGVFLLVVVAVDHPLWIWCSESIFLSFCQFFVLFWTFSALHPVWKRRKSIWRGSVHVCKHLQILLKRHKR